MNDKIKHFIAGVVVGFVAYLLFGPGAAVIGAALAGASKEIWDYFTDGDVDLGDFIATAFGGMAVELVMAIIRS